METVFAFFIAFGLLIPSLLWFIILRTAAGLLNPESQSKTEQLSLLAVFSFMLFVTMHELIMFKHGKDIPKLTNLHFKYSRQNFRKTQNDKQKMYKSPDAIALFFLQMVLATQTAISMPIAITYKNLDPSISQCLVWHQHRKTFKCHSL